MSSTFRLGRDNLMFCLLALAAWFVLSYVGLCAPAPFAKPDRKAADANPAWLCGEWELGWTANPNSEHPTRFPIVLRPDGSYSCDDGWYAGTWRLRGGHVVIDERYKNKPDGSGGEFSVPSFGAPSKIPEGRYSAGTYVWLRKPAAPRVTD